MADPPAGLVVPSIESTRQFAEVFWTVYAISMSLSSQNALKKLMDIA
jgi:hypothetical protein